MNSFSSEIYINKQDSTKKNNSNNNSNKSINTPLAYCLYETMFPHSCENDDINLYGFIHKNEKRKEQTN